MTVQEFSLGFDQLYDNIASNVSPGLNEYEKSVFLTMAQDQLAVSFYSGGFESSESARRAIDPILMRADLVPDEGTSYVSRCRMFTCTLPDDVWYRVFESVMADGDAFACDGGSRRLDVFVTNRDDIVRAARNPFKGAWDRRVLRQDRDGSTVELFSPHHITSYMVEYLRKPRPIILEDLPDGLTVGGETQARTSELGEYLHNMILTTGIELAKATWAVQQQSNAT